jgi:hypothetical protein
MRYRASAGSLAHGKQIRHYLLQRMFRLDEFL